MSDIIHLLVIDSSSCSHSLPEAIATWCMWNAEASATNLAGFQAADKYVSGVMAEVAGIHSNFSKAL